MKILGIACRCIFLDELISWLREEDSATICAIVIIVLVVVPVAEILALVPLSLTPRVTDVTVYN